MMGFRDRTFCTSATCIAPCDVRLTAEVEAAAARWWGGPDAPISCADRSPTCPDFTDPAVLRRQAEGIHA